MSQMFYSLQGITPLFPVCFSNFWYTVKSALKSDFLHQRQDIWYCMRSKSFLFVHFLLLCGGQRIQSSSSRSHQC